MPAKETYTFDQFLQDVHPEHIPFVMENHETLLGQGYGLKVDLAKSGYVVSYKDPKSKRVLLNYVFRKTGMLFRLYGDHFPTYLDVIQSLPQAMVKQIGKQPDCKRLLNPASCNSSCPMGYAFAIGDAQYKKCRYSCFLFPVNAENIPYFKTLLEKETAARAAA